MTGRMRYPKVTGGGACLCIIAMFTLLVVIADGFFVAPVHRPSSSRSSVALFLSSNDDDDELDAAGDDVADFPEKSQMNSYISNFLSRENAAAEDGEAKDAVSAQASDQGDDEGSPAPSSYTHLIALPVDSCHELMLELESVQRAILYHCPVLVHACITQAMTRLPLLYVETDANSAKRATVVLKDMVQEVVRKHIIIKDEKKPEPADIVEIKRDDDGTADMAGANADGIRPVLMSFQSLEIDGPSNEVLYTVADEKDESTIKLQRMVEELQERIQQETGWKTTLPNDDHAADGEFRPRIPFMRLPNDWEKILEDSIEDSDDKEEGVLMLTSDQGGNGISPIFWCQWWEDVFGSARMQEAAVYSRRPGYDRLDEQAFYVPEQSVPLPDGNAALTREEANHEKYSEDRMAEAEALRADERQKDPSKASQPVADDDPLLSKTRDRLEALYQSAPAEEAPVDAAPMDLEVLDAELELDDDDDIDIEAEDTLEFNQASDRPGDPDALDDWTRQRIEEAVSSRARLQGLKDLATPKEKPPIVDNPVFSKFKDGTLVPDSQKVVPARELPPFPSGEHCNGFWRVVTSPTGFEVEEGDSSRSDNLVLRVDGTIAGGPILDQETRQKASGGTWKLIGDTPDSAELRIRLVIPPTKQRIMVMKGKLEKVSMSSDLPMATSTFGIPELEAKASQAAAEMEDLLFCRGSVYLEDAVTGKNREEIGNFSISKLHTPADPSNYVITIPKPVRNQD